MPPAPPVSERHAALDQFLRSVQQRALTAARIAVPFDEALDCVQTAMFKFVRRYQGKPEKEWRPLFFRTLYNGLNDWHRRRSVRNAFTWVSVAGDELQTSAPQPDRLLAIGAAGQRLVEELGQMPLRQQQAFILRHWEGFDTETTARAMGVNPGTVKTHLSRAIGRLRKAMEVHHESAS